MPDGKVHEETMYIPGTDGAKMSKSKGNLISLFQTDKQLRKQIMGIQTDSTPMEDPKDPDTDNVFALYKILATESEVAEMRSNYLNGNYGYGHAKQALFEVIMERFGEAREKFDYYMNNLNELDAALAVGAGKAKKVADQVLERVRMKVGY
jgi:tryptophanyl-tRNA synthetase